MLRGGVGDDTLVGGLGADTLNAAEGNDVLRYAEPAELWGNSTDEIIQGFGFGDEIDLSALGPITWRGQSGGSAADGGAQAYYSSSFMNGGPVTVLVIDLDSNGVGDRSVRPLNLNATLDMVGPGIVQAIPDQMINGTPGNDLLAGAATRDTISGSSGDDTLIGLGGFDSLLGGVGADSLVGGEENDTLVGGERNDTLVGSAGSESFSLGSSPADGNDRVMFLSLDDLLGNFGNNSETIENFTLGDRVDLSAISELSFIGDGPFTGVARQAQVDDTGLSLVLAFDLDGDTDLDRSIFLTGARGEIEIFEPGMLGLAAPRNLIGDGLADTLNGAGNADTLSGLGGADVLTGLVGDDRLSGGEGNDTLAGGLGSDGIAGGAGNDTFRYTSLNEMQFVDYYGFFLREVIEDFQAGDRIDLSAIQNLSYIGEAAFSGVAGQVRFNIRDDGAVLPLIKVPLLEIDVDGNGFADRLIWLPGGATPTETAAGSRILLAPTPKVAKGTSAANNYTGTGAADTLRGGTGGHDTLDGLGGNDILDGGSGNDRLLGGWGNDTLAGGTGNDTLVAGDGADTLTGGEGGNRFIYNADAASGALEVITDFQSGMDKIDLSGIDANPSLNLDQAFQLIYSEDFSALGQVRFDGEVLELNFKGTNAADIRISLGEAGFYVFNDLIL